ncbi:MAG: sensor histidine kinase [Candidatus Hodarchaeales archaeon]
MEINPIALSAATSAFMAFIAAVTLIYDWYATGKGELPRLEWGIGMVAYGTGNLIAAFIYSFNELTDISFFVNISFSGAVSMSFLLYGTLILLNSNQIRSRLIAIGYGFIFIVSTFLVAFIVPSNNQIIPVVLIGEITNRSMMFWLYIEFLIPVSILIAFLLFYNLKQTQNIAFFWISLHFILHAFLLFLWPFEELRLIYYIGRALTTAIILVGVRELGRKKLYLQLIREAKAESAFLLDILTHDIKGNLHSSQLLLENGDFNNNKFSKILHNNISGIHSVVERVSRYRAIDKFQEINLIPMDLVKTIERNIRSVIESFPQNAITYNIHLDPKIEDYGISGNEFLDDLFLNIFHNAVKHHRNSPYVLFNISIEEIANSRSWKIQIEDDGPGIPENLVNSLFSVSEDESSASEKGIGHLIIRKIVKWYEGKIWSENRVKREKIEGATISVLLPKFQT